MAAFLLTCAAVQIGVLANVARSAFRYPASVAPLCHLLALMAFAGVGCAYSLGLLAGVP